MQARFITFEGGEGVGKSTQIQRLVANLNKRGVEAVRTREPGGTPRAEAIRSFLLQGKSEEWGPSAEAILFAAARLDHVNSMIRPNLESDKWVLSDRFHDSTRAYQGLNGGVPTKLISALEQLALDGTTPDMTILIDMDPELAFERVRKRAAEDGLDLPPDRYEKENLDWHRQLRQNFLDIAKREHERFVVIDGDKSANDLETAIWEAVKNRYASELDQ